MTLSLFFGTKFLIAKVFEAKKASSFPSEKPWFFIIFILKTQKDTFIYIFTFNKIMVPEKPKFAI